MVILFALPQICEFSRLKVKITNTEPFVVVVAIVSVGRDDKLKVTVGYLESLTFYVYHLDCMTAWWSTWRTVPGSHSRCERIWKWQVARTCVLSRRSAHLAPEQLLIKRCGPRIQGLYPQNTATDCPPEELLQVYDNALNPISKICSLRSVY